MAKLRLTPFTLLALTISSCGQTTYAGVYSFQMGKQSSTHMTASLTLGENVISSGNEALGQSLVFYAEAKMGTSTSSESSYNTGLSTSEDIEEDIDFSFDDLIMDILSKGITLNGYYKVAEKLNDGKNRLQIGFLLSDLTEATGQDFNLDHTIIEKIIYSEIDGKAIYMSIPVSVEDLLLQLYWYGFDLETQVETTAHDLNTHPAKEDVEEINKTYPAAHEGRKFRDYHVLTLSVTKQ